MGRLDEPAFDALIARGCPACGGRALALSSYLDRRVEIMLGDPNDDGRWSHDGEKFVDGVFRVACAACGDVIVDALECPRCHAEGGLARALAAPARTTPPKRCPQCRATELVVDAMTPAITRTRPDDGRPPPPRAQAALGEPGFHVVAITCDACGPVWDAPGCPLCAAPGPLRARP